VRQKVFTFKTNCLDLSVVLTDNIIMKLINTDVIDKFKKKHANSRTSLIEWESKVENAIWKSFADIKKTFNSVDKIGGDRYCFNIGGNNYRLIAEVVIVGEFVMIEKVLTHAEYTKQLNKNKL
jgi:mRNA interferase HigB